MRKIGVRIALCAMLLFSFGAFAQYSTTLPAGTEVHVRVDQDINAKNGNVSAGAMFPGTVSRDITDANGNVVQTRPICLYPLVAQYKGTGSVNDESSFVCSRGSGADDGDGEVTS